MIALGSDHGGYELKEEIKKYFDEKEIQYIDYGTNSPERTDYPIYAKKVAEAIVNNECDKGIIVCRSGHGVAIVANKFRGIRAANITSEEDAKFAKADDNINVLTLSGDNLSVNTTVCIIRAWLATEFKQGRYQERIQMIEEIENENMK
ncbi:MAG: ribose 5-phosphate isomerase B [Clostridia bacterium]|nr:ribose 5-phosphate isomerase B [Clostridia bacterium]